MGDRGTFVFMIERDLVFGAGKALLGRITIENLRGFNTAYERVGLAYRAGHLDEEEAKNINCKIEEFEGKYKLGRRAS